MLAERLGVAALTGARKLTVDGSHAHHRAADRGGLRGRHRRDAGRGVASGTPSTSRATRRSRASWRPRRSRCRRCRWPTSASPPTRWASPARTSAVVEHSKRPPRSGGTKVTDEGDGGVQARRVPRLREVRLRGGATMAEVLVVVEAAGGAVKKVTLEMLTLARELGEPGRGRARRPGRGRARWSTSSASTAPRRSTSPRATSSTATWSRRRRPCWPSWSGAVAPAAVLLASTQEGKEIAGRLAVKLDNGLLTDVGRAGRRRHRHPGRLRRLDDRQVEGDPGPAAGHRPAQLADPDAGAGHRRGVERSTVAAGRRRQAGRGGRAGGRGEGRPARS